MEDYSNIECSETKTEFTAMNNVMVLWRYSGHGELSQGHIDVHVLKKLLLTAADSKGKIHLKSFTEFFFRTDSEQKKKILQLSLDERARQVC